MELYTENEKETKSEESVDPESLAGKVLKSKNLFEILNQFKNSYRI